MHRWLVTDKANYDAGRKRVYYLSLEFLIGRLFTDALNNMGLLPMFETALGDLGVALADLREVRAGCRPWQWRPGAASACFMESMATLAIPAIGYGIRYDFGLFRQIIAQGWQQEYPDEWLGFGNPWEFQRPEVVYHVHFGGGIERVTDAKGRDHAIWHPAETVQAVAYDTPIVGWRGQHVDASAVVGALARPAQARRVRYRRLSRRQRPGKPARSRSASSSLRTTRARPDGSCGCAGIFLRLGLAAGPGPAPPRFRRPATRACVQGRGPAQRHPSKSRGHRTDAHSARHSQHSWEEAWQITVATLSYTNHTLLPEALKTWPIELFERLLPRHLDIIYRINVSHLALADARCPGDVEFRASVSLIDERPGRRVRMGQLAFVDRIASMASRRCIRT